MSTARYARSGLSALVDSDSEDAHYADHDAMPTPELSTENMPPAKNARGKTKVAAAKGVRAKAPARRASAGRSVASKKGRIALADKTNKQHGASDTEEVEEFEQQEEETIIEEMHSGDELNDSLVAPKKKGAHSNKSKPTSKASSKPDKNPTKSKRQPPAEPMPEEMIIQETQDSAMELDDDGDEQVEDPTPRATVRHTQVARAGSRSRQTSVPRRRAGSASDTERNDPAMRRKLGDMTKKLENLDLKYRNLREVGIKQAEVKFDAMRKQKEDAAKAAAAVIASLKSDLAQRDAQLKESREFKKKFADQAAEIQKLQAKVSQLTSSISEAHAENKTLSTKLAANRTAAAAVESVNSKVPGSAVKANGGIRMMGSAEAAQNAQQAQLKEDLYSDLTGLIIRGVKRDAEEDVFDCIQTGRNGTLHFKLGITNEKSAESYDEAQCVYIPQMDPSRDRDLIDMLREASDYLVDELTFPRPHAAKFYARVVKVLTEKQA